MNRTHGVETEKRVEPKTQPRNGSKPQPVKIRQMDIDDVAQVFHLGERLFEAESMPNLYRTWDEFEVIELFNGDTENCLVAEAEDEIVGFALGTTVTKSRSAWKYGHLIWLGVHEVYQRVGVAERLFHRFRAVMLGQGVRMLIVDTEAENLSALRFFRKMGFGSPQQHIYLSLNLAAEKLQARKKGPARRNGSAKDDG